MPQQAVETDFKLVCIADPQVQKDTDLARFKEESVPDIRAHVSTLEGPVYGITLGDIIFNERSKDVTNQMMPPIALAMRESEIGLKLFQVMGNHDNCMTPTVTDESSNFDLAGRRNFEYKFGPGDYSFDRGNAHIVAMDDILLTDEKHNPSDYEGGFTDAQVEWLRQDLSLVPKDKLVIVSTGSQGEDMSALYRMAFSQHKQIEVGPGDRVIISASAIPGNENTVSRVINELFRKGVEVIYDRADMLHVSGHACQEELKIIHALTKPKYFIPVHGEQRMLQLHKDLALQMGMDRKNIVICDNGDAVEIGARSMKCVPGYAPAGEVFVDGYGVGDVGAVVLRDRKHLAEDGMVVVVLPISAQNGDLLAEPEIITRGFIYVKDSEELLQDLRNLTMSTAEAYRGKRGRDLNELKGAIRSAVSNYLFKATKRSPMVLPVITKL